MDKTKTRQMNRVSRGHSGKNLKYLLKDKTLRRCYYLYHKGRFLQILQILEPNVFRYKDNFYFYYLLAMVYLNLFNFVDAKVYFEQCSLLQKHQDIELALAIIQLKQRDKQQGIYMLLQLLETYPKCKMAAQLLALLKKQTQKEYEQWISGQGVSRFFPKLFVLKELRRRAWRISVLSLLGVLAIFLIVVLVIPKLSDHYMNVKLNKLGIPKIQLKHIPLTNAHVNNTIPMKTDQTKPKLIQLNSDEIKNHFNNIKNYLIRDLPNKAQMQINFLFHSNASYFVKEKVALLENYIKAPNILSLKNNYSYSFVNKNLPIFNKVYVIWQGQVHDLSITNKQMYFTLLVNYNHGQVIQARVQTRVAFNIPLKEGDNIQVFGQIHVHDKSFYLQGLNIEYLNLPHY